MDFNDIFRGLIGMVGLVGIAYLFSAHKKAINWTLVGKGLLLQLLLAFLMLKVPFIRSIFQYIADAFVVLLGFTDEGVNFVFSDMWTRTPAIQAIPTEPAMPSGAQSSNLSIFDPQSGRMVEIKQWGIPFVFAFRVLPTVVFFSAFSAILYYLGILQKIIYGFAWVMSRVMKLSGAESIAAAANVFIGQTEAPLVIKPYLDKMTRSEIMCLMTGGMATIAGGVFALFVTFLGKEFALHFLTASIVSAPAAIVVAKILYPEDNEAAINTDLSVPKDKLGVNLLDAISKGTTDGIKLAVNVGAMLLVFIALVALVNHLLGFIGQIGGLNEVIAQATDGSYAGLSLEYLLGMLFAPIAWLIGVPNSDIMAVGQLLGKKTVINEVVAYADLSALMNNSQVALKEKSIIIATYALCGFANFASIGIQIGGIGAIAPKQRATLAEFGLKSMIGGTIACFLTAAIAGMFYQIAVPASVASSQSSIIVHREYLKPQSEAPFSNEYGRHILTTKGDSTFLEYCKDSTIIFHHPSGKYLRDKKVLCYPQKEVFVDGRMIHPKGIHEYGPAYRQVKNHGYTAAAQGDQGLPTTHLEIFTFPDAEASDTLMASHEYWHPQLGLVLKVDDNSAIDRKRIIQLRTAQTQQKEGEEINADALLDVIYRDSVVWWNEGFPKSSR